MNINIKNILLFLLLPIKTFSLFTQNTRPAFVSLGLDCETAWNLRDFKLRQEAYPFDWLITFSVKNICTLLAHDFIDFLNPLYLRHDGHAIIQNKYNIVFNHDFPTSPLIINYGAIPETLDPDYNWYCGSVDTDYLDHLDKITEKYTRRIKRLFDLLSSKTPIMFFRTRGTSEEALQFSTFMATHYPQVEYKLLVTYNDPNLNYDWNIPHVIQYLRQAPSQTPGRNPDWLPESEWNSLLTNLEFEKWKIE